MTKDDLLNRISQIKEKYGDWTFNIPLPHGVWTRSNIDTANTRLLRLMQVIDDLSNKPIERCRVLDLGCLDGGHSIELALRGAVTTGIEIREDNIQKALFCKECLGLDNLSFVRDDVRNVTPEKYGNFDIIICSGILYHLPAKDAINLINQMNRMAERLVIIDSKISLECHEKIESDGCTYWGTTFIEHAKEATSEQKAKALWSSWGNDESFLFTRPSLVNCLKRAGFSSVYECFNPPHLNFGRPGIERLDRCTFVAINSSRVNLQTSPLVNSLDEYWPEGTLAYASQENNHDVQIAQTKNMLSQFIRRLFGSKGKTR